LSFYLSPDLIKKYGNRDDFDSITINENVKVMKMGKKGGKNKKN
jgi:hypothetical protein